MKLKKEVITNYETNSCKLIVSDKFDGSIGQCLYKQRMDSDKPVGTDHSLLVTTRISFKIVDRKEKKMAG